MSTEHMATQVTAQFAGLMQGHIFLRQPAATVTSLGDVLDAGIVQLGKDFDDATAEANRLRADGSKVDAHVVWGRLGEVAKLAAAQDRQNRLAFLIGQARPRTLAGLAVQARQVAEFALSEEDRTRPIEDLDWDVRSVRTLIENICRMAKCDQHGAPIAPDREALLPGAAVHPRSHPVRTAVRHVEQMDPEP